jgi:hypothetical protein
LRHSAILALGLLACSGPAPQAPEASAFAVPAALKARLEDPATIVLSWENRATEAGGAFLEFITSTALFRHGDLAAETTFTYRVRPFFGRPSEVASVTTVASSVPGQGEVEGPIEEPPRAAPGGKSIRDVSSLAEAAPASLVAMSRGASSVDLRWKDRASDEDGYLVEMASGPKGSFAIVALLPPNATSFRKASLGPGQAYRFRARAFFYGKPSNSASATTGAAR